MNKILIILYLILTHIHLYSQNIIFNKVYNNFFIAEARNVINYKNGYLVLGGGGLVESPDPYTRITIMYIDETGEVIWTKNYGEYGIEYYHGTRNSLKTNKDGGYSLAGSWHNGIIDAGLLVKFNEDFDTLWTKKYLTHSAFYNHIETSTGEFILVGFTWKNERNGDFLVIKTDKDGNIIWQKTYGTNKRDVAASALEAYDGGYLIGGGSNNYNYLLKIDAGGNIEWEDHYGNPEYTNGGIEEIIYSQDSGYLALAAETIFAFSILRYKKGCIKKYNKELDTEWYKLYGKTGIETALGAMLELPNGDIAVTKLDGAPVKSKLLFLNSEGDSLRQVDYDISEFFNHQALLSIKPAPDNGFIMSGIAHEEGYGQKIWVVKTDECGCINEECDCNLDIIQNPAISNSDIEIYPNPAADYLYIKFNSIHTNSLKSIEIYDLTGRCVLNKPVKNIFEQESILNVSEIKSGLYILKIGNYTKQISIAR